MEYVYELVFKVRDYECDLQGVVNNAVYQNYMEHTRHEFMKFIGLDFARLHEKGINAFVARIEIAYKHPLRSGDEFVCRLWLAKEGRLKYIFYQDIYRLPDERLIAKGKVTATTTVHGRLAISPEVEEAFARFLSQNSTT
ncbi:MAG: acyl-CoA thioesterase [Brevinematales bacterium]